ncbi:hypothetical protein [Sphingosinicella sp. YJ22]|uniref:hypothetical protein n=1 Tax=Sphingosinicella sp. YJ22 TaxID=1104780 RepID=UPI00140D1562|nr:hypothetical protein [Sphingosinicella sp. YJ22]
MSRPASKATVILSNGNLHFTQGGVYTIDYLPSGNVQIKLDGGKATVLKPADYASITSFSFAPGATLGSPIHINGVTFTEAGPGGPFEINLNLDSLIGHLITTNGIEWTVANLVINGSQADTFKTLWDYLDDAYVAGGNPFNVALNETFVRLGVEYVSYIEGGGDPFTDVTAKFAADTNANGIPQREQSMHDNLLGNLTIGAINARFGGDPVLKAELLDLIPDDYEARLLYEGLESQVGGPRHDNVRAFDYDKGWDRPDYLDRSYNALVDPLARDGSEMYYGDGNTVDDWNVVRHEGAGVELALKIKHRGGDEYPEGTIDANGVAHYRVLDGAQPGNPNRAEWNFDFAATDFSPDDDFTYTVEIDVDPGAGVSWLTVYSSANPLDTDTGLGSTFQNSSNYAFYRTFIDTDPVAPGVQPYAFGEGTFNIRLSAFDADSGLLVASNEVVVHVDPLLI